MTPQARAADDLEQAELARVRSRVPLYQAKVVPKAEPNADGVWVTLPADFEVRRVSKGDSIYDRGARLFSPRHHTVAFRVSSPSTPADYESVQEWRDRA